MEEDRTGKTAKADEAKKIPKKIKIHTDYTPQPCQTLTNKFKLKSPKRRTIISEPVETQPAPKLEECLMDFALTDNNSESDERGVLSLSSSDEIMQQAPSMEAISNSDATAETDDNNSRHLVDLQIHLTK